jgi:hypothetical protein
MKVVSYLKTVPNLKNPAKTALLNKFIVGVNAAGDTGIVHTGADVVSCDVGVIQGWVHETGRNAAHLKLREAVAKAQTTCVADSNLFLFASPAGNPPHFYLRYSFNGVFPDTGIYFDDNPTPDRWNQISKDYNLKLEPAKPAGNHILICSQRNGGWSMGDYAVKTWLKRTIGELRKYTNRRIIIRPHPGDAGSAAYTTPFLKYENITISQGNPLADDLINCHAVVNHNSSSIVGPLIMGYPGFITDPAKSQCAEVTHHGFENIELPLQFDREKWLHRISMFHYKFSELEDGTAWRHMRKYV